MKRKFQHYVILVIDYAILPALTLLFIFGWVNLVYHLAFNNPVILKEINETFQSWKLNK